VDTQVFVTLNTYKPFSRINPEQASSVKGAELPGKRQKIKFQRPG
jgi:hypothetical protein